MTTDYPALAADLREKLDAATDLPWASYGDGLHEIYCAREYDDGETGEIILMPADDSGSANAELTVAAVNALPALLDHIEALTAERDAAQAEASNVGHDYDRRGEKLWRLAALAGWTPGNPSDNDATAELYVKDALAERDALTRWKSEALPIIDDLQGLGQALGCDLGEQVTGPLALVRAHALAAECDQLRATAEKRHIVHVTAQPVAEDVVWCDICEEWVESGAPASEGSEG